MERWRMPSGLDQIDWKLRGHILLSALAVFFISSMLFFYLIETYSLTVDFTENTSKYYIAKTMKELALSQIDIIQPPVSYGRIYYLDGTVEFRIEENYSFFYVVVSSQRYHFKVAR